MISMEEYAALTGLSVKTLRRHAYEKRPPLPFRLGNRWYYAQEDVDQAISAAMAERPSPVEQVKGELA